MSSVTNFANPSIHRPLLRIWSFFVAYFLTRPMRISFVLCLVLFQSSLNTVWAGNNIWTQIGPEGGHVRVMVIDPVNLSTLYAVSNYGRMFKSADGGDHWQAVSGLTKNSVYSIAIDPLTPSTIYAGTLSDGIFKSTDSGSHWLTVNSGFQYTTRIISIAIDPITPSTLYAGTEHGTYKSTDSGGHWLRLTWSNYHSITIDLKNPTTLYAINNDKAINRDKGISKSIDSGVHWLDLSLSLPITINHISVDPSTTSTLYAGTVSGGIYKSTDGGAHWLSMNSGIDVLNEVYYIAVDPVVTSTLYAGTQGGVYKSTDSSAHWLAANFNGSDYVYAVQPIIIDPSSASTLYLGTRGGGIFKSTDGGAHWLTVNNGLLAHIFYSIVIDPSKPSTLYAGTEVAGIFKSTDEGLNWLPVNSGLTYAEIRTIAIDPNTPATLYAATRSPSYAFTNRNRNGIFKSIDGGANWTVMNSGLPGLPFVTSINSIAIDPLTSATLYAGTGSGTYKSTDGGGYWLAVNTGLTNAVVHSIAIDPLTPSTLYAGTHNPGFLNGVQGVYKSADGSAHWSAVNSGLPMSILIQGIVRDVSYDSIAIDPLTPSTLYTGTNNSGMFKSTDGGVNWFAINSSLSNAVGQSIAIDPISPSIIYAGVPGFQGGGLFMSSDAGIHWQTLKFGLPNTGVLSIAIDPGNTPKLYAGTDGGIFSITVSDTTPPSLVCPADVSVNQGQLPNLGMPVASDDVDNEPGIFNNTPTYFPVGTTAVTWTAADFAGNRTNCTQQVVVSPPAAYLPPITNLGVVVDNQPSSLNIARLLINKKNKSFSLVSNFTLGTGTNGINPLKESINLRIGNLNRKIPARSFKKVSNVNFTHQGAIKNVIQKITIKSLGNNLYAIQATGKGFNFRGITNPVTVSLGIGDDKANNSVVAIIR